MGRSEVKYRATHGRGRGRGRGVDDGSRERGGGRRSGGAGGSRALESNAYRYNDNDEEEQTTKEDAVIKQQPTGFRKQFFASEQNYREPTTSAKEAYFQSQTMKQWDAEEDDDGVDPGVLDIEWIGEQLAKVPPAVRYRMDPKYCVDFPFEFQQLPQEEAHIEQMGGQSDVLKASASDNELELLLQISSKQPVTSAHRNTESTAFAAAPVQASPIQQQSDQSDPSAQVQLEEWLDTVLDM